MPDIFLSYARADAERARKIAKALSRKGWDTWWDATLTPGTRYRAAITEQLRAARCVVVLWSTTSVKSDWVIDEAEDANRRHVLVQALIETVHPPHGFGQIQAANLVEWPTDGEHEFERLCAGIVVHAPLPPAYHSTSSTHWGRLQEPNKTKALVLREERAVSPAHWQNLRCRFNNIRGVINRATLHARLWTSSGSASEWAIGGGSERARTTVRALSHCSGSTLMRSRRALRVIDSREYLVTNAIDHVQRWLWFIAALSNCNSRDILKDDSTGRFLRMEISDLATAAALACDVCEATESGRLS